MKSRPQFLALLTFLSPEDGNNATPVSSGYRPEIKFPFDQKLVRGKQNFMETELVFPGDVVQSEITILTEEDYAGKFYSGLDFEFYEGEILIGHGVIIRLIDEN